MHTLGKWEVEKALKGADGCTFILAGSIDARVQRDPPAGCAVVVARVKHAEDAPIIAAAPAMLAALKAFRDACGGSPPDWLRVEYAAVCEAIDSAEGR